jgi:hypothetical protein
MYSADDLCVKLREIEALIREKTNSDGSCDFDPFPVMVSLELTRRMITREGNSGENSG